jgi:hypothetical protein
MELLRPSSLTQLWSLSTLTAACFVLIHIGRSKEAEHGVGLLSLTPNPRGGHQTPGFFLVSKSTAVINVNLFSTSRYWPRRHQNVQLMSHPRKMPDLSIHNSDYKQKTVSSWMINFSKDVPMWPQHSPTKYIHHPWEAHLWMWTQFWMK